MYNDHATFYVGTMPKADNTALFCSFFLSSLIYAQFTNLEQQHEQYLATYKYIEQEHPAQYAACSIYWAKKYRNFHTLKIGKCKKNI